MNVHGSHNVAPIDDPAAEAVESMLERAIGGVTGPGCPPRLAAALRAAVFPGGARLRPGLCVAVASACGGGRYAAHAAAAVELVHCASLVHDDLPCFDDADTRRGCPSVHKVHGVPLAVLAGDALIVLAFEIAVRAGGSEAGRQATELASAAGASRGIIAGQAWESEPTVPLAEYHRAKTGALFRAAAAMGAIAAGAAPAPWRAFGDAVGRAYQIADDLDDVDGDARALGKPTGRDAALGRPNAARLDGPDAARARAQRLVEDASASIPPCLGRGRIRAWLDDVATRRGLASR